MSTFSVFVRCELWVKIPVAIFFSTVAQLATTLDNQEVLQGRIPDFSKGGDFCKGGGVTINCPITKICELKACFLYFFLSVSSKWGITSQPFHPPGSALGIRLDRISNVLRALLFLSLLHSFLDLAGLMNRQFVSTSDFSLQSIIIRCHFY